MVSVQEISQDEPERLPSHCSKRHGKAIPVAWAVLVVVGWSLSMVAHAQLSLVGWSEWAFVSESARFGHSVAIGDFNGDGLGDLAIGLPLDDTPFGNVGRVILRLSQPSGIFSFHPISSCEDSGDTGSGFRIGASLAFGYFDDDQYEDLAIGMPGAAVGGVANAGAVCIVYGGSLPFEQVRFDQGSLAGVPEGGDLFGDALAAGDLNGDGIEDLVVGVPGEAVGVLDNAGAINLILGGPGGLSTVGNQIRHRGQGDIGGGAVAVANEAFGSSVVIGDFHGGDPDDLAVGAPGEHPSFIGGSVTLFYIDGADPLGNIAAPFSVSGPVWDLLGTGEPGDEMGAALAAGNFDGKFGEDLAIGIPGDGDFGAETEAGAVMVLYSNGIVSDIGEQVLYEAVIDGSSAGVNNFDRFGEVLAAGDFNRDGFDDLAVGAPLDNSLGVVNSGEVTVLYGSPDGLTVVDVQLLNMIFFDILEIGDEFGFALASGRVNQSSGGDDLFIGVPGRAHETGGGDTWLDTGRAILVESASLFLDGFEQGDTSAWDG